MKLKSCSALSIALSQTWIGWTTLDPPSSREREDKEITLDLNHLWIPRDGSTQAGEGILLMVEKKFSGCERGCTAIGRLPAQAPAQKS